MKIYTKRGDSGMTDLYDGSRLEKTHEIFDALGTLDELSSHIGMLICNLFTKGESDCEITCEITFLREVQQHLLTIGSIIATPNPNDGQILLNISDADIKKIEFYIDAMDKYLEPLTVFIKVGGVTLCESQSHICRVVCRRAERCILKCNYDGNIIRYMNRLSDYFFTLSRYLTK